ncbi:MAG: DUF5312 family protein [Spirochaetaceae bacterium]|jgi:hypothetical protein|nr:DUF5312 family protein [Spirochaetaceae bacterium]
MGFLDAIFELFGGGNDPEARRKRALKQLVKEINQNKYRKLYKAATREIAPPLGSFFFDIYKAVASAQQLMRNAEKSAILKQITVESLMSKELKEVYDRLTPEAIAERSKAVEPKALSAQLNTDIDMLSAAMSIEEMNAVDQYYRLIIMFTNFVCFDYFTLLKKIDPRMQERNTARPPQLRFVSGRYMLDHIKDFISLPIIEATQDQWKTVFDILKRYKGGVTIIEPSLWKKTVGHAQDVQRSGILTLMTRHILQDPQWQQETVDEEEYIVEAFFKAKKQDVQKCIDKIIVDTLAVKQDNLAKQLFGSADITRLQYYTNANNEQYLKRNTNGFTYVAALNYLKAFLVDHNDLRELCDLFLIKGHWASQDVSRQISQGLHEITEITAQLTAFDEALGDSGVNGTKLKGHISKSKVDKGQITHLKVALSIINDSAKELINRAITSFTLVGMYLKDLQEDYARPHPVLLVNWREIEAVSEQGLAGHIGRSLKVIDDFIHLMELFVNEA